MIDIGVNLTSSQFNDVSTVLSNAQENNVKIVFDVADPFAVSRNKDSFIEMIKQDIDIVFANKSELNINKKSDQYCFWLPKAFAAAKGLLSLQFI